LSEAGEGHRPPAEGVDSPATGEEHLTTPHVEESAFDERAVELGRHKYEHLLDGPLSDTPPDPDMPQGVWDEIKRRGKPQPSKELSDDDETPATPAKPGFLSRFSRKKDDGEHGTPEQKARQEIENLSGRRGFGRELTPDEEAIIEAKYLDQDNLNRIDQETIALYNNFENLTKSSKLKTISRNIAWGAIRIGTSAAIGTGIRTGLQGLASYFHVGTFGAGAITGSLVGLGYGYFRGIRTGERQVYGATGFLGEYDKIIKQKGQSSPLEYRQQGLAFLKEVLENPINFKGDHNELMQVLSRYRQDTTSLLLEQHRDNISEHTADTPASQLIRIGEKQMAVDEEVVGTFLQTITDQEPKGQQLLDGYRNDPTVKATTREARNKAMLRGLLIGGGVGLASDIVGPLLHSAAQHKAQAAQEIAEKKAANAYQEAYRGTMGDQSQYHPGEFNYLEENPLEHVQPGQFEHVIGLDTAHATQYGNALSHALRENYITTHHFTLPDGMTDQQINDLVHASNFAHSNPGFSADVGMAGGPEYYHFDDQNLKEYVERAYELMQNGNKQGLNDLVSYAERTLHENAYKAGLDAFNEATNKAAEIKIPSVGIGADEVALHGAAIGGITGATSEYFVKHHDVKVPGEQAQQEPKPVAEPTQPPITPLATRPAGGPTDTPEPVTETVVETSPEAQETKWEDLANDIVTFNQKANETLSRAASKSELEELDKKDLAGLLIFLADNQAFNVLFTKGKDVFKNWSYVKDAHTLSVSKSNQGEGSLINLFSPEALQDIKIKISKKPPRGGQRT